MHFLYDIDENTKLDFEDIVKIEKEIEDKTLACEAINFGLEQAMENIDYLEQTLFNLNTMDVGLEDSNIFTKIIDNIIKILNKIKDVVFGNIKINMVASTYKKRIEAAKKEVKKIKEFMKEKGYKDSDCFADKEELMEIPVKPEADVFFSIVNDFQKGVHLLMEEIDDMASYTIYLDKVYKILNSSTIEKNIDIILNNAVKTNTLDKKSIEGLKELLGKIPYDLSTMYPTPLRSLINRKMNCKDGNYTLINNFPSRMEPSKRKDKTRKFYIKTFCYNKEYLKELDKLEGENINNIKISHPPFLIENVLLEVEYDYIKTTPKPLPVNEIEKIIDQCKDGPRQLDIFAKNLLKIKDEIDKKIKYMRKIEHNAKINSKLLITIIDPIIQILKYVGNIRGYVIHILGVVGPWYITNVLLATKALCLGANIKFSTEAIKD